MCGILILLGIPSSPTGILGNQIYGIVRESGMKLVQLARGRIAYPGLVRSGNSQPEVSAMEKRTVMLQETSREREKEEIRTLFQSSDTLYYSDIVGRLGISLRTVVEICDELKAAGEIALDKSI